MYVQIQPFRPEHQQAARRLILDGMAERWGDVDPSANPDLDDIAAFYGDAEFFLALHGDDLVTTGGLMPESDSTVRITRMWVRRLLRRSGIGTQMLLHLLTESRRCGCRRVVLETTDTWHDAIAFYKKLGFRIIDHRNDELHFAMELAL